MIEDSSETHAGIALNEKIAGLTIPDITCKLNLSNGFRGSDLSFHKWCYDPSVLHWNKARNKVRI